MTTLGGYSDDCAPLDGCGVSGCYGSYQRTLSNADAHSATYGYTHDYTTSDFASVGAGSTWSGLTTAINKIKSGYGPQVVNVSYSFIASGSRVKPATYRDPKTYQLKNYAGTRTDSNRVGAFMDPAATGEGFGFSTFSGEVVRAFDQWKNVLEDTFRGLTVCFKNYGEEGGTGLYNDTEISDTTPFDGFYKEYSMLNGTGYTEKVGDIRLGGIKMGRIDDASYSEVAHSYYPNNNNFYRSILAKSGSVGGDIFFNLSYNWRTGEYSYNAVHKNTVIQQYSGTYDIKCIAAREIGNALGIPSETNERSIMYDGQNVLATFDSLYPSGLLNGQATKSYSNASYGTSKSYYRDPNGEINSYIRNNF
jgi:hypothetical protein